MKFGYYDDEEDVKQFLPAIYKFLNGMEDFPTKQIKQSRDETMFGHFQQRT